MCRIIWTSSSVDNREDDPDRVALCDDDEEEEVEALDVGGGLRLELDADGLPDDDDDRGGGLVAVELVDWLLRVASNCLASVVSYIRSDLFRNFSAFAILPSEIHFLAMPIHRRASPRLA